MSVVQELAQALKSQPENPLRNHQVEEYKGELRRLEQVTQAPAYVTGVDRGAAAKQHKKMKTLLEEQAAKPLRGAEKDLVAAKAKEVLENVIRPSLVPQEEMRRNPAGAVGKFLRTENSSHIQEAIQHWKRAQLALEPESPDPDLANVERFRPVQHTPGQAATFMADAQIPGHFAMTRQAKENWPADMPAQGTLNHPLAQAVKRERTPAQIAHTERLKAAAAARRAQREG